jgi:putative ABC transport system substrate-binding protein
MQRRSFITILGGAAAAWPLAARAQQPDRMRRVGVLIASAQGDLQAEKHLRAFQEGLSALRWVDGKNVQIDYRFAVDIIGMQSRAAELINLGPDVIVTNPTPATNAVRQATHSLPSCL